MACQSRKNNDTVTKSREFSHRRFAKDVPELNNWIGMRQDFLDNNIADLNKFMDDGKEMFKEVSKEDRVEILKAIKQGLTDWEKKWYFWDAQRTLVETSLKELDEKFWAKGYGEMLWNYINPLRELLDEWGYRSDTIFRSLGPDQMFSTIGHKFSSTLTYEMMTKFWQSSKKMLTADVQKYAMQFMWEKQAVQFAADFLWDTLGNWKFFNFMQW